MATGFKPPTSGVATSLHTVPRNVFYVACTVPQSHLFVRCYKMCALDGDGSRNFYNVITKLVTRAIDLSHLFQIRLLALKILINFCLQCFEETVTWNRTWVLLILKKLTNTQFFLIRIAFGIVFHDKNSFWDSFSW